VKPLRRGRRPSRSPAHSFSRPCFVFVCVQSSLLSGLCGLRPAQALDSFLLLARCDGSARWIPPPNTCGTVEHARLSSQRSLRLFRRVYTVPRSCSSRPRSPQRAAARHARNILPPPTTPKSTTGVDNPQRTEPSTSRRMAMTAYPAARASAFSSVSRSSRGASSAAADKVPSTVEIRPLLLVGPRLDCASGGAALLQCTVPDAVSGMQWEGRRALCVSRGSSPCTPCTQSAGRRGRGPCTR
jgi:hypothetical protein